MEVPRPYLPNYNGVANRLADIGQEFKATQRRNALADLLPKAYAGDQNALGEIARVGGPDMYGAVQNDLFQRERLTQADRAAAAKAQRDQQLQGLKWGAGAIIGAQTPEQRASIYETQVLPRLTSLGFQGLPQKYDPSVDATANSILERFPDMPKAPNPTSDMLEYEMAKAQGFQGSLLDYQTQLKKAGAARTEVSVNSGQKGFDNELKIRGDFRTEPVYKAFQETDSAYKQINAALDQKSPAGDLAAATKIMKILDPGSVVRESELGMAMAASGLLDRVTNYANKVVTGQKLTPTQREDFRKLADEFYDTAGQSYNAKRSEYHQIASDYGMDAERVTGPAPKGRAPKTAPVQITGDDDYAKLPSGAQYMAPDGSLRRKK